MLMDEFFREVTAAARSGRTVSYAQALYNARQKVRKVHIWSAPLHWASFTLIGPE